MLTKRLGKEPQPYVTRHKHLNYPAGTKCMASRPDLCLVLEFEDGEVLTLAPFFYAQGLEEKDSVMDEIAKKMDEETIEELERIAQGEF